jgi:hypothetical protein
MWSAFLPGRLDAMPIKLDRKPSSRKVQYGGSPLAEAANGSSQLTYFRKIEKIVMQSEKLGIYFYWEI